MAKRLNKNLVGGLTALAFVVITAAGVFMVSSLGHVDLQHCVQKAEGFAADGDYDKAATCYWRAFRVSENPEYLVDVGNMTELSGDEIKAVQTWIRATNIDSELLEAHEKILDVYMQGWPASRIKETAEAILRIEEKNPKGLHALGVALIQLAGQPGGDREKGFENLEAACEIAPEVYEYSRSLAFYYWNDATTLVETKPEEARGQVGGQALSLVRDLVAKNVTPGEDAANARILYARLLSSPFPPQHEKVLLSTVNDHLGDRDRYTEAEALFQQAVEMAGDDAEVQSEAMTELARYWYVRSTRESDEARAKEYQEKAVGLSRQAIETWSTGFSSYRLLAQIFASGGEYEKAAQVCVERADLPIDRKGLKAAVQKRGRIQLLLFAAEQYIIAASLPELSRGSDEQLALAEKAEQLVVDAQAEVPDPDRHGQSLHVLGKIKYVQGREREALACFENADKADGTPTSANKRWLGILRFQQGQIGGAREALLEAIRNNRRADAQTWLTLAKVHLAYDEPENAILSADEALKRSPGMIEALQVQIAANRKLGRQDLVDKLMEKIGEGQPENSVFRARVLYQQGRHQEAFDMLSAVLDENPASEPALRWLGVVARKLEKEDEALARAEKAVKADPDNLALRAIAIELDRNLTEEQQKERLLSLIRETPDEYVRAYRLGEFYHTYDQPREAMGQYGKAAQLITTKATEAARRAGSKGLLVALEKQLLLAIDQEWWDEIDAIVQAAIEQNVDGAHGMTFKGRVSLVRGQYAAATEAFRLALAEQPSQSETWGWLGESHYLAGRKTEARAAFTRAAEMNRNNFMAQRRLAQLAEDAGDLNDFNARLDQCVRLNPQDSWVQQQELVRQENKNPQEGIKRRLVHFEQNPEDWRNLVQLANLYRLAGNVEKATEFFSTALQNPDAPPGAAWRAAQFHAEIGDRDRAFQVLSDAGERAEPKQDKALILLLTGILYRQLNDLDNSEKLFRQAVDLDPGEVTFIAFGEHYMALGTPQYPEALEWLEKGIEAADQAGSARAPTTRRTRFDILLRVGDHDAATTAVEEYRNLYPRDPVGYLLESELQVALGEVDRAIDRLTRFLQDRPGDPEALSRRARLYASRQRWQAAIKDLEDLRAIDRDALNFAPRILLSRAYDRTDRSDLALSELKSLYEEHPDNDAICLQYFGYFLQHGRFADAETLATALVNRAPDNPVWHGLLGRAAARLKDSVKALASYREAARKSEDRNWKHRATLLDAYRRFDNHDAGIRFYEETLTADQIFAPLTYRYANLLADMGRTDEAVTAYRQALIPTTAAQDETFVVQVAGSAVQAFGAERAIELFRAEPADESLKRPNQHVLARLLANLDHHSEAMGVLDSLIRTSAGGAELASLYGRKGIVAEMDGDPQRARQYYEEAIKANPSNYVVLNNLAFLLADKLGSPREAVPYAEKAVQITKQQQPDVVDTLAWTLVELGEYGRAIGLLTGALQRNLEFVPGLAHRAEAYRRSGRFDDAVSDFEEASKLIDDSEDPNDQAYREQVETGLQKARDRNAEP